MAARRGAGENVARSPAARRAACVLDQPPGRGAKHHHRRPLDRPTQSSRRHRGRGDERHLGRSLHVARQHEPARGQGLVVRRATRPSSTRKRSARSWRSRPCKPTRRLRRCRRSNARSRSSSERAAATDAEVATSKKRSTLTLPGRWETARAVARDIAELVRFGLPDDYWNHYAELVERPRRRGRQQRGQATACNPSV